MATRRRPVLTTVFKATGPGTVRVVTPSATEDPPAPKSASFSDESTEIQATFTGRLQHGRVELVISEGEGESRTIRTGFGFYQELICGLRSSLTRKGAVQAEFFLYGCQPPPEGDEEERKKAPMIRIGLSLARELHTFLTATP